MTMEDIYIICRALYEEITELKESVNKLEMLLKNK